MWRIREEQGRSAQEHMATDVRLAQEGLPTLRLFTWNPPAISLGWKQPRPDWMSVDGLQRQRVELVERPTGGGMALHGSDLSCSVVAPHGSSHPLRELMGSICRVVAEACEAFGVQADVVLDPVHGRRAMMCLTEPSEYAVLMRSRKVAGFAIRRYTDSWLVQGSWLVRPLPSALKRILPASVLTALAARAVSLSEAAGQAVELKDVASVLKERWIANEASAASIAPEGIADAL